MGANRTTFEKLQRDRAKKAKAAAKRERRTDQRISAPCRPGELEHEREVLLRDPVDERVHGRAPRGPLRVLTSFAPAQ